MWHSKKNIVGGFMFNRQDDLPIKVDNGRNSFARKYQGIVTTSDILLARIQQVKNQYLMLFEQINNFKDNHLTNTDEAKSSFEAQPLWQLTINIKTKCGLEVIVPFSDSVSYLENESKDTQEILNDITSYINNVCPDRIDEVVPLVQENMKKATAEIEDLTKSQVELIAKFSAENLDILTLSNEESGRQYRSNSIASTAGALQNSSVDNSPHSIVRVGSVNLSSLSGSFFLPPAAKPDESDSSCCCKIQ